MCEIHQLLSDLKKLGLGVGCGFGIGWGFGGKVFVECRDFEADVSHQVHRSDFWDSELELGAALVLV